MCISALTLSDELQKRVDNAIALPQLNEARVAYADGCVQDAAGIISQYGYKLKKKGQESEDPELIAQGDELIEVAQELRLACAYNLA